MPFDTKISFCSDENDDDFLSCISFSASPAPPSSLISHLKSLPVKLHYSQDVIWLQRWADNNGTGKNDWNQGNVKKSHFLSMHESRRNIRGNILQLCSPRWKWSGVGGWYFRSCMFNSHMEPTHW
jgi:hypothetical protein